MLTDTHDSVETGASECSLHVLYAELATVFTATFHQTDGGCSDARLPVDDR